MPSPTIGLDRVTTVSADHVVAHTLLNCFVREVAGPERQATLVGDELHLRLPRLGRTLRIADNAFLSGLLAVPYEQAANGEIQP